MQKEIKPIISHKQRKPNKPCIKIKSSTISTINDVKKSYNLIASTKLTESTNLQGNLNNYNSYNNSIKEVRPTNVNHNELPNLNGSNKHSNELLKNYTNLNMNNLFTSATLKSPQNSEMINIKTENKNDKMSQSISIESNLKLNDNQIKISAVKGNDNLTYNPNSINSVKNNTINHNINKQTCGVNLPPPNYYYNNNSPSNIPMNTNTRQNNFKMNTSTDNSKTRSYSVGQDPNKHILPNEASSHNDPKIIIASKYQNIVNNFNNIIIQSTEDLDKFKPAEYQNNQQNIGRPNSLIKRGNNNQNGNNYNSNNYSSINAGNEYMNNININPIRNVIPQKKYESQNNQPSYKDIPVNTSQNVLGTSDYLQNIQSRLVKDSQKMMQNNFFSSINENNSSAVE